MIEGPFSEDYFWYDESESDPEFLDHWSDPPFTPSSDDWGWDEWGDLIVFRPLGHEPGYNYPLVICLSQDEVPGVALRDWFPDLSDRNYIGAEVQLPVGSTDFQNADRVAVAIREVVAMYGIHMRRIWMAGVGEAADAVLRILPLVSKLVTGGIAIAPTELATAGLSSVHAAIDKSLYLAIPGGDKTDLAESMAEYWTMIGWQCALSEWESMEASRLAICRDLNTWLMQQVSTPAGQDSRG